LLTLAPLRRLAARNGDETMARKRTITTVLLLTAVPSATLAIAASARTPRDASVEAPPAPDAAVRLVEGASASDAADPAESAPASDAAGPAEGAPERPAPNSEPGPTGAEPPPDDKAPPALIKLRFELFAAGRDGARAQTSHFRPLCDRDGYPLVGNMASKGNLYQPSEFCAELRRAPR
jgi:hypothetical protein